MGDPQEEHICLLSSSVFGGLALAVRQSIGMSPRQTEGGGNAGGNDRKVILHNSCFLF